MPPYRVQFKVQAGPNDGDTVSIESGACRLIGRHLSENETAFIDPNGNRVLDHTASTILAERLQKHVPQAPAFSVTAFDRGQDECRIFWLFDIVVTLWRHITQRPPSRLFDLAEINTNFHPTVPELFGFLQVTIEDVDYT